MCVCVDSASNSWTGLHNMLFWVKTRYIFDKQMVSRVFTPLGSRVVREGRVQASFYLLVKRE